MLPLVARLPPAASDGRAAALANFFARYIYVRTNIYIYNSTHALALYKFASSLAKQRRVKLKLALKENISARRLIIYQRRG
jgi:hypothetical protein